MASVDALRHVSIGRYLPGDSPLHRADPRAKLVGMALLVICGAAVSAYASNLLLLIAVLALVRLSRTPMRYLWATVRPALPVILTLSAMQLLFYRGQGAATSVFWQWGGLHLSWAAVRVVVVSWMRFVELLFLVSLLTNTTPTGALTYGLERLLRPLDALGLPGHELSLVGSIALRFVPILGEQLETIVQAQAARGVGLMAGSRWRLAANARRSAALVVPLFVDAYRRAEELALAMQARCYRGGRGRTHLVDYRMSAGDWAALAAVVALCALIVLGQYLILWP